MTYEIGPFKKEYITEEMKQFVKLAGNNLLGLSDDWWADFWLGCGLQGITVNVTKTA